MREIAGRRTEIVTRKTGQICPSIASFPALSVGFPARSITALLGTGELASRDCIQPEVSVLGPRMRFLILLLTLSGILVFGSIPSGATPIKVDLKRLIDQAVNARPYE